MLSRVNVAKVILYDMVRMALLSRSLPKSSIGVRGGNQDERAATIRMRMGRVWCGEGRA